MGRVDGNTVRRPNVQRVRVGVTGLRARVSAASLGRIRALRAGPSMPGAIRVGRIVKNGGVELLQNEVFPPSGGNIACGPRVIAASDMPQPFGQILIFAPQSPLHERRRIAPSLGALVRHARKRLGAVARSKRADLRIANIVTNVHGEEECRKYSDARERPRPD